MPVAATVVILRDTGGGPEVLMIERPDRGSFAGAWVFPGGKLEPADGDPLDEFGAARRAAARETWEETGLRLDAASLAPLSCWDPPPGLALRIRTWFFLATDPGGAQTLAPDEVIAARWVRPAVMLERHARGEVTLYPPTWVTLHELAPQSDAAAMLADARVGGVRRYESVARRGAAGPMLLWQGDAEYEETDDRSGRLDPASRHRLEMAALPWVYTRTG
ncbi:8-oxo-dGTP pyrophosphatase MutT, NUDIX family [Microbacterium sp. cf046]|nr:8-oxo-dGTP pyrophosphatase MutT, NUDIX family [Microbacterium sp. cf046]